MKENFPSLMKEIDIRVQEAQRVPSKIDEKRLLKAAREKKLITCRGIPISLSADFSKETLQVRGD